MNKTRREVHVSHVIPSFWYRIEHNPIRSKFLVPEKSGTRMHDTRSKFLVRDSGTSSWAENLSRVPWALVLNARILTKTDHAFLQCPVCLVPAQTWVSYSTEKNKNNIKLQPTVSVSHLHCEDEENVTHNVFILNVTEDECNIQAKNGQ